MREDPHWPRASHWLAGQHRGDRRRVLHVAGVPMNSSITPGRCDLAPGAIREALSRYSLFDPNGGVDLEQLAVRDFGDCGEPSSFEATRDFISETHRDASAMVLLGGDNGITRPGVHALGVPLARCGVLTFDAHHDFRELEHGLTNGNPISALVRDGLPGNNIVQIGIQPFTNSASYARGVADAGIKVMTADEVQARGSAVVVSEALDELSTRCEAIYVDLDVDVLDRAFAPACPGSRPGGLQPWMLREAARVCGRHERVRMMDIVEIDPTKDIADVTVLAAASFLLAFASGVASRP